MSVDYELNLSDYLQIFRRRVKLIAGVFVSLIIISVVIALTVPPVYESTGTILIESQQIPSDLVQSSVTTFADERIEVIRQRVMTRENLMRIVEKYGLFQDYRIKLTPSELMDQMRKAIIVEVVNANVEGRIGKATIAFKLSFDYRYPDIALKVTNELVTLFLDENVKSRTEGAKQTTEFLEQESARLKDELGRIESQVAAYKQQHANALPEHLELLMGMMPRVESELQDLERDYKDTQDRLGYLEIELASAKAGIGSRSTGPESISPASELEKLQSEYAKLIAVYKETHPDVRALKRKIEALEKAQDTTAATTPKSSPTDNSQTDLMVAKVQSQIASANSRLASIEQQRKALRSRQAEMQTQIAQTPQVEYALTTLLRDYDNAKKKYEEVASKLGSAKISENLEQENKGERFSLLEPPLMPDKPIKPNRMKIIAMGFFLSLAAPLGLVMMLENMDQRVRGVESLSALMGMRPMAVIPYITIQSELGSRKSLNKYMILGLLAIVLMLMAMIHVLVMPLDILLYKVLAKVM